MFKKLRNRRSRGLPVHHRPCPPAAQAQTPQQAPAPAPTPPPPACTGSGTRPAPPRRRRRPAQGSGAGRVRVGYLNCQVARGVGFSVRDDAQPHLHLRARAAARRRPMSARSSIRHEPRLRERGVIVWGVDCAQRNIEPGSLAGNYGGVAAGVADRVRPRRQRAVRRLSSNQFGLPPGQLQRAIARPERRRPAIARPSAACAPRKRTP
jgi:hypothetical protein